VVKASRNCHRHEESSGKPNYASRRQRAGVYFILMPLLLQFPFTFFSFTLHPIPHLLLYFQQVDGRGGILISDLANSKLGSLQATPEVGCSFIAPQKRSHRNTEKLDVYSFAMLMWELWKTEDGGRHHCLWWQIWRDACSLNPRRPPTGKSGGDGCTVCCSSGTLLGTGKLILPFTLFTAPTCTYKCRGGNNRAD